jgi:hypothetical protein
MSAAKKRSSREGAIPLTISTMGLGSFTHSLVQEALKSNSTGYSAALTEAFKAPRDVIERCAAALLALASLDDCVAALVRNTTPELRTLAGIMRKTGSSGGKAKKGTKTKHTLSLARSFDVLVRKNPDLSGREVHKFKASAAIRKMPYSTFVRHWSDAKNRAQN